MYTIKLPNGVLTGLSLNGNNYISPAIIPAELFSDLSHVEIVDEETLQTTVHSDMKLVNLVNIGTGSWFILDEKSPQEKFQEQVRAAVNTASSDITNIELALTELYEMIIGGD